MRKKRIKENKSFLQIEIRTELVRPSLIGDNRESIKDMSENNIDKTGKSNNQDTASMLDKFDITALNPMQEKASETIRNKSDLVLLSPTGTGMTLAFLLPLIDTLDEQCEEIQILILVPSRELAQQIEQVARQMGSGYKVNAVYGGRSGALDKIDLTLCTLLSCTTAAIAGPFPDMLAAKAPFSRHNLVIL